VVPANEPLSLKERILEVISLPEAQREKIRMDASERIVKEFSLAVQEGKFIRFYGV
jgi:glycosyltransferase involved in cell wall biosynthesis